MSYSMTNNPYNNFSRPPENPYLDNGFKEIYFNSIDGGPGKFIGRFLSNEVTDCICCMRRLHTRDNQSIREHEYMGENRCRHQQRQKEVDELIRQGYRIHMSPPINTGVEVCPEIIEDDRTTPTVPNIPTQAAVKNFVENKAEIRKPNDVSKKLRNLYYKRTKQKTNNK